MKSVAAIIILALAILGLAGWTASITIRFLYTAVHAEGTVVDLFQTKEGLWYPAIEFSTREGRVMRVESGSATNPPAYKKGQTIDILYQPDRPEEWRLNGFMELWFPTLLVGAMGGIILTAGIGFLFLFNDSMPPMGNRVMLLLGVTVFGVLGLLMLWGSWHFTRDTRNFLPVSVPVTGKVVAHRVEKGSDSTGSSSASNFPTIEFFTKDDKKVTFLSNLAVDGSKYPVGSDIKVLYNKSNPDDARIDSFDSLWGSTVVLAFMGLMFVTGALLVYFILYREVEVGALFIASGFAFAAILLYTGAWWFGRDSIYLLRNGVRVSGIVVDFNPAPVLEFRTREGKTIRYMSNVSSNSPKYSRGDTVPVLYDPNEPSRAHIDSFDDMWVMTATTGGMGSVFLMACIYAIFLKIRNG